MDQSSVPKAANLDILAETVTDTGTPPSAAPQMRSVFAAPDMAVSEATAIIKRRVSRSEFRLLLTDEKVLTIP